jgi:LacI family transcriptional regulator
MTTRSRILLLSDNVGTEYISRIQEGVAQGLRASAMSLESCNLYGTTRSVEEAIEAEKPDGIVLTAPLCDDRPVLSLLEGKGIPFVRIAPMLDLERGHWVRMDEYEAARAITALLTKNGHRRIAILKGPGRHLVSIRRYNGFVSAIGAARIKVDLGLVFEGDFSRESGRAQASNLFRAKPTGIFACNDEMALGIIEAANAAGVRIPQDISLVGFDGNSAGSRSNPSLTTVRQPLGEMGEMAGRIISDQLQGKLRGPRHEEVDFELVERNSISPVADEAGAAN